jgi:hypothetical protein
MKKLSPIAFAGCLALAATSPFAADKAPLAEGPALDMKLCMDKMAKAEKTRNLSKSEQQKACTDKLAKEHAAANPAPAKK